MEAGSGRTRSLCRSLRDVGSGVFIPSMGSGRSGKHLQCDRFIPSQSAMDFDIANCMLTEPKKKRENISRSKNLYQKVLAEVLLQNRTRILAFNNKPRTSVSGILEEVCSSPPIKSAEQQRYIPQTAEKALDAPDLIDDYYLNLLDWGNRNVISVALRHAVYLWDAGDRSIAELTNVDEDNGPVTSVSWAPDGQHIAVGLNSSDIQLWDTSSNRLLRVLRGVHQARVGALAWNNDNILTTGGMDGLIANNDVRVRSHVVQTLRGHQQEVCGLKWSGSGRQLASGGNDELLYIWDMSMASAHPPPSNNQWIHRFEGHMGAVRALAWCPFQSNLIASGGGVADRCIKFWNTRTGACLNSVDTGSQVCALLWNKNRRELLSSHGYSQNQLTLWRYPSMVKIGDLRGHTSRVLYMAQSPDGCRVASAAGDETLRLWNVFGTPEVQKPAAKTTNISPFTDIGHIR